MSRASKERRRMVRLAPKLRRVAAAAHAAAAAFDRMRAACDAITAARVRP